MKCPEWLSWLCCCCCCCCNCCCEEEENDKEPLLATPPDSPEYGGNIDVRFDNPPALFTVVQDTRTTNDVHCAQHTLLESTEVQEWRVGLEEDGTKTPTAMDYHYDYSKDHMAINVSPSGGYSGEESALLPVDDDTSEVTTYEFQIRQRQQQT
ncbi:uncharacterized protein [Dysidea avara]|uniref:uncharacterized protein n=1 Tax=Dysidea avara TaxID=196820 RepID=UPI003325C27E